MLETIKTIFQNASVNKFAEYYKSRLQASKSVIEAEAIVYMNSLMSFYELEEQTNEKSKMRIEHVAIWCKELEEMKRFYTHFFNAKSNDKYENKTKGFSSYFLTLPDGPRIELMQMDSVLISAVDVYPQFTGLAHIAFSVGSELKVDAMAASFIAKGYEVLDGPRWTGDGYYECVVLDPEWNRVEIVA